MYHGEVTIRDFADIYDDSIILKWYPDDTNPDWDKYYDEDFGHCLARYFTSTRDMIRALTNDDDKPPTLKPSNRINSIYFDDGWFCMDVFESENIESWYYSAE